MSTERFTLFEETFQTSRQWIRELCEALDTNDEQQAYHALCATLQALRDRLTHEEALQFGAQLPVLIRGLYYEGWRLSETPRKIRDKQDFIALVASRYHARPLADLEAGVRAVFAVISQSVSVGEALSLVRAFPEGLRELWPTHIIKSAQASSTIPIEPRV